MARRVLIVVNSVWNVLNFRMGLVRALRAQGYDVIVAAAPDHDTAALEKEGCRFVPIAIDSRGASVRRDFGLFLRYRRLLAAERPDIILGYTIKPNIYCSAAARLFGIPMVNNISGLGTAFIHGGLLGRLVTRLYALALSRSRCVFFQNPDDRALFLSQRLVHSSQARLLPGSGVDLRRFQSPGAGEERRPGGLRFLLIARMLWDKGVGEYVEAARIVKRTHLEADFALLGFLDVENRSAIPRETVEGWAAEGVVRYLGHAEDVRPHIADCDCVVLPSYREGTPRTLLEAGAMGKPLIATDVPGCRNVVDHGVNGYLCEVKDAEDLARAMTAMIELPAADRAAMGQASRHKIETEFDERLVVDCYLEVIRDALVGCGEAKRV
ncbi:MAG TPA: glycosyltransferase family 4 protein [Aestuariivirga sp.]|nr:glycosyltransferase family 4 protein [Aestuariivirga sp.]